MECWRVDLPSAYGEVQRSSGPARRSGLPATRTRPVLYRQQRNVQVAQVAHEMGRTEVCRHLRYRSAYEVRFDPSARSATFGAWPAASVSGLIHDLLARGLGPGRENGPLWETNRDEPGLIVAVAEGVSAVPSCGSKWTSVWTGSPIELKQAKLLSWHLGAVEYEGRLGA